MLRAGVGESPRSKPALADHAPPLNEAQTSPVAVMDRYSLLDGPACTATVAGSQVFAAGRVPSSAVTVVVDGPVNGTAYAVPPNWYPPAVMTAAGS